jgi:hypothetical protein
VNNVDNLPTGDIDLKKLTCQVIKRNWLPMMILHS